MLDESTGIPRASTLEQLGLKYAADNLAAYLKVPD